MNGNMEKPVVPLVEMSFVSLILFILIAQIQIKKHKTQKQQDFPSEKKVGSLCCVVLVLCCVGVVLCWCCVLLVLCWCCVANLIESVSNNLNTYRRKKKSRILDPIKFFSENQKKLTGKKKKPTWRAKFFF